MTLAIGVTGHRILAEPERVAAGVESALDRIEATFPGRPLVVISALAEGADRLVAEAVLGRPGSRLRAMLPMPQTDYLADFASPESRDAFLRLLARADEVVELPTRANRDDAYAAANEWILERIDVLVAVWDGRGAQGLAGTAEVVARARARSLPLAWIHAGNTLGVDQGPVTFEDL